MRTKQGNSAPKFVRRSSRQPWEAAKPLHIDDLQNLEFGLSNCQVNIAPSNNLAPNIVKKQPITSIRTIPDDSLTKKQKLFTVDNNFDPALNKVQQTKYSQIGRRDSQDIKFTYIPIQSVSTVQSIPTTRKKITEFYQQSHDNRRADELISIKKDLQKFTEQNRALIQSHKQKDFQISRLKQQTQRIKFNCNRFQNEIKQLKVNLLNTDKQLRHSKISLDNLQRVFEVNEMLKLKSEERTKQVLQKCTKLDTQLKFLRNQNRQIKKNFQAKQRQFKILTHQLSNQVKSMKNFNSMPGIQNRPFQSRSALVKSLSINETSINSQKKQSAYRGSQVMNQKMQIKCNRFIQTQKSQIGTVLKQNQGLTEAVKLKENIIKCLQIDVGQMQNKTKFLDEIVLKLEQSEILIHTLNEQIMHSNINRLGLKYKYY